MAPTKDDQTKTNKIENSNKSIKSKNPNMKDSKKLSVLPSFGPLLRECLTLLNLGVVSHDSRIIGRVLRRVSTLRHLFESEIYLEFVRNLLLPSSPKRAEFLLDLLKDVQPIKRTPCQTNDTEMTGVSTKDQSQSSKDQSQSSKDQSQSSKDQSQSSKDQSQSSKDQSQLIPLSDEKDVIMNDQSSITSLIGSSKEFEFSIGDVDLFLSTLGMMLLIDNRRTSQALPLATSIIETLSLYPPAYKFDGVILGKAIFYSARTYELEGLLPNLRGFLMQVYRTSILHCQATHQAIVLNLLLRNFLQMKLYDQAVKFLEKAPYPEGLRSNAQHSRYLYYLARINAVRLDYGEAYSKVIQAIRKAPQEGSPFGKGFRLAAHKLCFVIQLLMGEIPDRQIFNQKDLRAELLPYSKIVQAVRSGGLASFKRVMEENEQTFIQDGNIDLVQRLHHNVIRAGLKKINASYSAISLDDIALKLGLDSSDDCECIVSKAIADGIIDATIEFETRTVKTKTECDKRISNEPRKAFNGRIAFCLQLYNDAVRSMQYPETEGEIKIDEAEARRKEHQEQLARAEKDEFDDSDTF